MVILSKTIFLHIMATTFPHSSTPTDSNLSSLLFWNFIRTISTYSITSAIYWSLKPKKTMQNLNFAHLLLIYNYNYEFKPGFMLYLDFNHWKYWQFWPFFTLKTPLTIDMKKQKTCNTLTIIPFPCSVWPEKHCSDSKI